MLLSCAGDHLGADTAAYRRIPVLIPFGDFIERSGPWKSVLDECQAFAERAARSGARVELVVLPGVGSNGNSHMMMLDTNNLDVAAFVQRWLRSL